MPVEIKTAIVEESKTLIKDKDTTTMKESVKWYTSKKFWLGVASIVTAVITAIFPVPTTASSAIIAGIGALNIMIMSLDGTLTK